MIRATTEERFEQCQNARSWLDTLLDTAGYEDGQNLYQYVGSSPGNNADPTGLFKFDMKTSEVIVEQGDSLWKICAGLTGNGNDWKKVFGDISTRIKPGQRLKLTKEGSVRVIAWDEARFRRYAVGMTWDEFTKSTPAPATAPATAPASAPATMPATAPPDDWLSRRIRDVGRAAVSGLRRARAWLEENLGPAEVFRKTKTHAELLAVYGAWVRSSPVFKEDPAAGLALIWVESNGDPNAYRYEPAFFKRYIEGKAQWKDDPAYSDPRRISASYGAMQVMYTTAVGLGYKGAPEGLYGVASLNYGSMLYGRLLTRYRNNPTDAYAAYNAGSVRRGSNGQYLNQRNVDKFVRAYEEFKRLLGSN